MFHFFTFTMGDMAVMKPIIQSFDCTVKCAVMKSMLETFSEMLFIDVSV